MQGITELLYILSAANRPGRMSLVDVSDRPFTSATVAEAAGLITINLPVPTVGWVRRWSWLTTQISSAVVTDALNCAIAQNAGPSVHFFRALPNSTSIIPVIGGRNHQVSVFGVEKDVWVTTIDTITVQWIVTAASGQTADARGRYCDFPI